MEDNLIGDWGLPCSSRLRENHFGTAELRWPTRLGQARSVWSIWLVSCNLTHQTDRTDQMDKTGWQNSFSILLEARERGRQRRILQVPWHFLYFFPLPQGQGSLRPTLSSLR